MHRQIIVLLSLTLILSGLCKAQEKAKVMENRAREMVRVIGLDDREAWKGFIRENFTKSLINKGMQAKKTTSDDESVKTSSKSDEGNVEGKAGMFERLHGDFGVSKITSLTIDGEVAKIRVHGAQFDGTFTLKFTSESPWLIDGLGIEVGN